MDPSQWPVSITPQSSEETRAETKVTKEVLAVAQTTTKVFGEILEKLSLWKTPRVSVWVRRFLSNCRKPKPNQRKGPISTEEIDDQRSWWIKKVQAYVGCTEQFETDIKYST